MFEYRVTRIEKEVDGDTIWLDVDLGFRVSMELKFRLADIDAWEIKGEERPLGLLSKAYLFERVSPALENGEEVIVKTDRDKSGSYNRFLATIYINGVNINQEMVTEGHAVPYTK